MSISGFRFASCSAFLAKTGHGGMLRSAGETSFLYEVPQVMPDLVGPPLFDPESCAWAVVPVKAPKPISTRKMPMVQRTKASSTRSLKAPDSEAGFFFIGICWVVWVMQVGFSNGDG